jgi:energy-coupling factor transport system substrate-specific component
VTWQLAAFALLGVALVGGFAWYERIRPDPRLVALVGTLAAFAALGRMAFAALPNVKPTTDIVLVSGFALGGAPGFVVGASAALTSNFFFGQGPWTPWQMAGWALVGLAGAGLALLTRGRIGRLPLAAVCFALGFAFTAMQDLGDWVNYSDHSSAALWVYLGKGLGFDLIHATGCMLFALAFGPALVRSLRRFRDRSEVRWRTPSGELLGGFVAVALAGAALALTSAATNPSRALAGAGVRAQRSSIARPLRYLLRAQNRDGGFGPAPGSASSPLYADWVALSLAASGRDAATARAPGGATLLTYLESTVGARPDADTLERTILAARAMGTPATEFAGRDLPALLERDLDRDGSVAHQTNLTAFALLALRAAGVPAPRATTAWLVRQQDADGGFNFATAPGVSDVDDTAAVLEALSARRWHARARAIAFLRAQQNGDGGFPSQPGAGSNAQSTAFALQGLIAAGIDPRTVHRHGGRSPLAYLRSMLAPDGHVRYQATSSVTPVWVTAQAVPALVGRPLPISR